MSSSFMVSLNAALQRRLAVQALAAFFSALSFRIYGVKFMDFSHFGVVAPPVESSALARLCPPFC